MTSQLRFPIYLAITAAIVTLFLKGASSWVTGSVGLFSDAMESLVNLFASLTALFGVWYAARPIDADHTYGHEKIEYFVSGLEGVLVLVAAFGIGWVAVARFLTPHEIRELGLGAGLSLIAAAINGSVAMVLLHAARRHHSIVLEADGKHLLSDVYTSVVVVAGLVLASWTGLTWLDPLLALIVAVHVSVMAVGLVRRSFDGLMDHALPESDQHLVRITLERFMSPGLHFHAVRTRQAGARRFVDFHLLVPGAWSVGKAHDLTEAVEQALRDALPRIEVTVHIEPIEEQASWRDSDLLAVEPPRSHRE